MNPLSALQGVFQTPTLHAAAWGFISTFVLCVLMVITKRWHGALTMDFTDGVQKFHTAPTPRVGGVPIVLGLIVAWAKTPPDVKEMLTPILLAGMPAFFFGVAEDITKRVGVMQRLLATMASGLLAWWITDYSLSRLDIWGVDWFMKFTLVSVIFTAFAVGGVANSINIIDGFNGLASTMSTLAFIGFGMIAWQVGDKTLASTSLTRLMVALLYLKHAFNESDEEVIQRWGETPTWQYFSGNEYFEHQWPCDPTQLGRFRKALGEDGVEELLARTMEVAVTLKLIAKKELTRVIVDSTVQEKAVAHPTDSKLLETARSKVVELAKANGIELKQTYAKEGQLLGYKAGRYAHARQFKRMRKMIKRQRTIVGRLQREVARKMTTLSQVVQEALGQTLDKTKRLVAQTGSRKAVDNRAKLYSWHAPEVECISKGKDKRLTDEERRLLKRRQAIEPIIGHLKADHRMDRCHLKGSEGDALHAVLCAAGCNIRWLLRMIARKGLGLLLRLLQTSGLTDLFARLAEISGINRLQNSDQRRALA